MINIILIELQIQIQIQILYYASDTKVYKRT